MFALLALVALAGMFSRLTMSQDSPTVSLGNDVDYIPPPQSRLRRAKLFVAQAMQLRDPVEIDRRANRIAKRYPGTAKVLRERAETLRERSVQSKVGLKSPFPGVSDVRWTKFARTLARPQSDITPENHIGIFRLAYPRLVKLGKAVNPRKEEREVNGKKRPVWTADLIPPLTLDALLKSPSTQYKLFVESITDYDRHIAPLTPFLGKEAQGKKVTRSGLLALMQKGGAESALDWLNSSSERREKYPHTTAAFLAATEIF